MDSTRGTEREIKWAALLVEPMLEEAVKETKPGWLLEIWLLIQV